jgi:hypothetical protein
MARNEKNVAEFLGSYEKAVVKKLRELQATQSFGGSLKINTDRVFVEKKDGLRALEHLRQMSSGRLVKAK